MILITGDTHGYIDFNKLKTLPMKIKDLTYNDYVIIAGDFGGVWSEKTLEQDLYHYKKLPFTVLFVDGNHENFDLLEAYPVTDWNGGKVHRISDSIIHLMRGQVYAVDGKKLFTMGGALSHDREHRVPGRSVWDRELPSLREYDEAIANFAANGNAVDYIFTHCASSRTQYFVAPHYREDVLTHFFREIEQMDFKAWYFGHYHVDQDIDERHFALFDRVIRLW